MKSYASIGEVEEFFVVCEVELIPMEESKTLHYRQKETDIVLIPNEIFTAKISEFTEGDIIVVEHEKGEVKEVYYKDDSEKARRIELIREKLRW